jgi:hypothetical protein
MIQFWRSRNIDKQDGQVVFSEEDKKQTQLPESRKRIEDGQYEGFER